MGLGVVYLVAIALLGPLLGSTADSTRAYVEHFSSNANLLVDVLASFLLVIVAALLVWLVVVMRHSTRARTDTTRLRDILGAASLVSASGMLVAAGLLATVPVSTAIGNLTGDPGIDPPVQAGIAQAGTVVLVTSMLAVGATSVLAAHLGHAAGAVPRWIVVAAWLVAAALILGITIALLFPFGAWAIALGLAWKERDNEIGEQIA